MKKFLAIAVVMILQIVLPTLSQAVLLNIQHERPFSDDDGDGTVGNDIYTVERAATQTVFKVGEQGTSSTDLNFDRAYYCLRSGLGFGSTDEILASGVNYTELANLKTASTTVKNYYKNLP